MIRTVLFFVCSSLSASAATPNVLLIIGDDQHYGDYGFMGHPHIQTPHLDRLAKESLVFERGYVPTSLCRASLATMTTGLYPHQHRITSNDPPLPSGMTAAQANKDAAYLALRSRMVEIFERSPNLPKLLSKAGYVSHQSGKWWEGNACRCGFSEGMTVGDYSRGGRHGDAGLTIGRQGLQPVFDFIDKARSDNKPFFAWYAPMMPHAPHAPPERLLAKYRGKSHSLYVAKYWAMCEWFDETIGELLDKLKATGLSDTTIVIYLHDNGWIQDPNKEGFAAKSKRSPYDGGLRTPILIRWPGHVKARRCADLAGSIDLAPTILKACGLQPTDAMPGMDLLDTEKLGQRTQMTGAIFQHNAVDIAKPGANLQSRWIVDRHWKLIVAKNGTSELYDLSVDPKEEKNRAGELPKHVEALRAKLDTWWDGK